MDWSGTHVPVAPSTDTVTTVVKPGAAAAAPTAIPLASSTAMIMAMTAARRHVRRHGVLTAVPLNKFGQGSVAFLLNDARDSAATSLAGIISEKPRPSGFLYGFDKIYLIVRIAIRLLTGGLVR